VAKHRLVALGDSLTQGFMSGAIFATHLSYPSLIAREMGLNADQFRYPTFSALGGLPVNLERMLRMLEREYGPDLNVLERLGATFKLRDLMAEVEDYWERGPGQRPRQISTTFHNLASWGMTVDDAVRLTAGDALRMVREPTTNETINQIPERSFQRTILSVLNPSHSPSWSDRTALGAAKALADDGGIENLLVLLGANNALGAATSLRIKPTDDRVLADPVRFRGEFNLWEPEHFAHFFGELVDGLAGLDAERVFLGTVPHVTIVPLMRGVGRRPEDRLTADRRYFDFYTHFWITDEDFRPGRHPHLTGDQARRVDETIDAYNRAIRAAVDQQRGRGRSWHVVDIGGSLDRVAFRRYREVPGVPPPEGGPYEFPESWERMRDEAGLPELTTHFLSTRENRLVRGGLFSLDGVHPTTLGYGLLAHEFIKVMEAVGVPFFDLETGAPRPGPIEVDFPRLLRLDPLVRVPPGLLDDTVGILNWLDGWIGLGGILRKVNGC
jgi:hypothetical protein